MVGRFAWRRSWEVLNTNFSQHSDASCPEDSVAVSSLRRKRDRDLHDKGYSADTRIRSSIALPAEQVRPPCTRTFKDLCVTHMRWNSRSTPMLQQRTGSHVRVVVGWSVML